MPRPVLLALAVLAACLPTSIRAQQEVDRTYGFVERSVTLDRGPLAGQEMRYRVLRPADRRLGELFPVVLFLHGAGERGDDNLAQLRHFPERMARPDYRERFRALVIAPQVPRGKRWVEVDWDDPKASDGPAPWLDVALGALDQAIEEEHGDPDQVYLTGLSMGGFGSWHLAAKAPERFAAVVPICGGGNPAAAANLAPLPLWAWHGAEDYVVHPDHSRRMVKAIRQNRGTPIYSELPGVGHDSWSAAYSLESGVLDWMFARRRGEQDRGVVMACDQKGPVLRLLDVEREDWSDPRSELWSWSPSEAELPDERRGLFAHPTDAKPIFDGSIVLGCASGGGAYAIRLIDKRITWLVPAGSNPHSVEYIHPRRAVVASSTDDRLALYEFGCAFDAEPLHVESLEDAHALHWDAKAERLWALGGKELRSYRLKNDQLLRDGSYPLPETETSRAAPRHGGHDLIATAGGSLLLSDLDRLWTFDRATESFAPFEPAPAVDSVKSITELRPGGPFLLLAADEEWWSSTARLIPAEKPAEAAQPPESNLRTRPEARFYKLRAWR